MKPTRMITRSALAATLALTPVFVQQAVAQTAGGRGPVQVLLVTKGHSFDRQNFFAMFDALGNDITWTHVEHPAAQAFYDPDLAEPYDVLVFYDMAGRTVNPVEGQERYYQGGSPGVERPGSTARPNDIVPSAETQANFAELLRRGKGLVFFHHSLASWVHTWPEYTEVIGGGCDWGRPIIVDGKEHPLSGYRGGIEQRISVVNPSHPVVAGIPDGFSIIDETYLCPFMEDKVTPLLRTDFVPSPENFPQQRQRDPNWNPPTASNLTAWVKTAENSPVVYIQHGHDARAWENENFRKLMTNAINWAASDEAHNWAKANPTRIFR
jgi:type 1 glutamine amidotransferase